MNNKTDQQLLREYAVNRSEPAFAELVRRHIDFVFSAALRMVRDAHLAEDVTQGVFLALARSGNQLTDRHVLSGWLHRTAQNLAANTVRSDVRRRAREQEAAVMNETLSDHREADWKEIEPHLDVALGELSESDRDAVLLRYFEGKSARQMAETLGISDEAAQKRVSRAVERLREFLSKRGVNAGASGLAVVLSANAVQSAPMGLAAAVSSAAALAGTAVQTSTALAATHTIAMTTIQKTIIGAALAAAIGTGIYEARQASQLRHQLQALRQQQEPLTEQIQQLRRERDETARQLTSLREENERLNRNTSELLKLRGEVGMLRRQPGGANTAQPQSQQTPLSSAREYYVRAGRHSQNHEYEAQLEDLNKALELDPNFAEALFDRASLYAGNLPMKNGGYAKAVEDYSRFLELRPDDCSARHNRALYYEQLRQYDNAIADYTTLIEGNADFSRIVGGKDKQLALEYHYRGRAYQWYKKDFAKAIADYTEALRLDPNIEGVHQRRAQCYEALGQNDKAGEDFAAEKARSN